MGAEIGRKKKLQYFFKILIKNLAKFYEGCPKSKFPYFVKKQRRDQLERKFIYK